MYNFIFLHMIYISFFNFIYNNTIMKIKINEEKNDVL